MATSTSKPTAAAAPPPLVDTATRDTSLGVADAPTAPPQISMSLPGVTPADVDAYVAAVLVAAQPKKSVTVAAIESKSVLGSIKIFLSILDENLCSLRQKMGATLSFLMMFWLIVGTDFPKNLKYDICCGVAILLCIMHPSPWAHRLSGGVVLYAILQILCIFLSRVTGPYLAVFFGVCAAGLILKKMMTA